MEYNYGNPAPKEPSMSERISSLYESIGKVLSMNCKLNEQSMVICHSIGYNGFKRWHRYRTRQFNDMKLCLANELFDKFRITYEFKDYEVKYSPKSLQEHLGLWEKFTLDSIKELGLLNQEYFKETGSESKIICTALCKLMKDYEKLGRYISRFNESDWLVIDMHSVDDHLHCKYKEKEECHGHEE